MVYSFSKPGIEHKRSGTDNQDRVCVLRWDGRVCAAVADGWGGSNLSQLGAEAACRGAAEYLLTHFDRLYGEVSSNTLRYEVALAVQVGLDRLALELGVGREKLASTLLVLCRDPADGRYISFHIGDGLSAWWERGRLGLLSAPTNGMTRQFTTLTDSPRIFSTARVHRGRKEGAVFLLMTDGCTGELWNGAEFRSPCASLLEQGNWAGFEAYLTEKSPRDDYSFVAL